MKRYNFLYEEIVDYGNIRLAFLKALRGNRQSPAAIKFCRNTEKNLSLLRNKLLLLNCDWGNYRSFLITDPKPRIISTAPFEQRVMHHAMMNVLENIFERQSIYHNYACRKGKGTHAAVRYAFKQCKTKQFFLKLDIRKYFDSIDHEVLKTMLRRLIKDKRVIFLLDGIINSYETDPGKGLPIGNLTSQFFANLYLTGLDHYILEELRASAYCRYMDDFVVWVSSQAETRPHAEPDISALSLLKEMFVNIDNYVTQNLKLSIKQPVFGKTAVGLPFLGFLIKEKGIYLLQKSKKRFSKRMSEITTQLYNGSISEAKAAERTLSVFSAISLARTNRLRNKVCAKGEQLAALTV